MRRALLAHANDLRGLVADAVVLTERRTEIRDGERRSVARKVYPGYVLVAIETRDEAIPDEAWHLIRGAGVRFVGDERPRPMSPTEVASMERQLACVDEVAAAVTVDHQTGDPVRVKEGSFAGFEGVVESVHPERGVVCVTLSVFGRATPIEFQYWKLERAS